MHRLLSCLALFALLLNGCLAQPGPHADVGATPAALEHIDGWDPAERALDVYFVPSGDAVEARVADELLAAERSIRVAMYNIRSRRLADLLLERHHDGLAVELLLDAKQMAKEWNTLGAELAAAGLDVVPVQNDRSRYATLHDKFAVIDDETVIFGSANWSSSGLFDNEETLMVLRDGELAAVVAGELDELRDGARVARSADASGPVQLYFSPTDRIDSVIERAIEEADERIVVAVFSLRLSWLVDALLEAHARGVDVFVVTDQKQADFTDTDETLAAAGIPVVTALNATTPFTAMHHKFMVIDGETTFTGSYNWSYTATFHSHEDLAVIHDEEVAAAFEGEAGRVWQRYGGAADLNPSEDTQTVRFAAWNDGTAFGDTLAIVGDHPALGAWDPTAGVRLDGATWPTWRGSAELRPGERFEYKLVLLHHDGRVTWERGANRVAFAPTDDDPTQELSDAFRW